MDLAKWADDMPKRIETAANKVAVSVSAFVEAELTMVTPVDTTKALSNWIVSIGVPAYNDIGARVPGYFGYTATASRAATLAAAQAALAMKRPGQLVYIGNNAPYIRDLNNGSSKQEPAGFVERAAMRGRNKVATYKLNL